MTEHHNAGGGLPFRLDEMIPVATACEPAGFDLKNSDNMRMISVLALRFLTKDQIIGIMTHILQLSIENSHEAVPSFYAQRFGTKEHSCGHSNAFIEADDIQALVRCFEKQGVVEAYQQEKASDGACVICGKIRDLKSCGRCHQVKYCSKKCQSSGWKKHKRACHS